MATIQKQQDPKRIDGSLYAAPFKAQVKEEIHKMVSEGLTVPGIGVVLVGDRKDSMTYVSMKHKAAVEVGMHFELKQLPVTATEDEIIRAVEELNNKPNIHGILVQLPLPPHIDEKKVLLAVSPEKDIDGFHPVHIGNLALKGREPLFAPCTPTGCLEILRKETTIQGKHAVVIGKSNIVGIPMALLLLKEGATITVCHSKTQDIENVTRQGDIVVVAVGSPQMVKKSWIKPGAIVIDVGINSIPDATRPNGYRLVGDVDYADVHDVVQRITPVPGGVGPMTVAMLLRNTVKSAKRFHEKEKEKQPQK
jgi:5,10-methylene-tetrahydrofolate dehydrogenase/methenyl tetrahydrofolate cyclohydrolase